MLDSAGPSGRNCTSASSSRHDEGADRGPRNPTDHLDRRPTAWAKRLGRFDSPAELVDRRHIDLTEDQQGGSQPQANATANAGATEETVGTVAVADEPATSPSLASEADGTENASSDAAIPHDNAHLLRAPAARSLARTRPTRHRS